MSEPTLVHLFQKLLGDGIAGGVGVAVRAEGSGLPRETLFMDFRDGLVPRTRLRRRPCQ